MQTLLSQVNYNNYYYQSFQLDPKYLVITYSI